MINLFNLLNKVNLKILRFNLNIGYALLNILIHHPFLDSNGKYGDNISQF